MTDPRDTRLPVTLDPPVGATVFDDEVCDDCGDELSKADDEIHVSKIRRDGGFERTVLCGTCKERERAEQAAEMPELYSDDEIADYRERFPEAFDDGEK